ncbi:MAG: type II toxin-antitoxin system HicB family antitoxin [Candidatus Altiarchaeota archaeon]
MKRFKVALQPQTEGGYFVQVIGLPNCFTEGDTKKEAIENARDVISLYIDYLKDEGVDVSKLGKPDIVTVAV